MLRVVLLVAGVGGAALYSSFWAPLLQPRLLQYRVHAAFVPGAGLRARAAYQQAHGRRGEALVAALGAGAPPDRAARSHDQVYGPVSFYYTYPGANGTAP